MEIIAGVSRKFIIARDTAFHLTLSFVNVSELTRIRHNYSTSGTHLWCSINILHPDNADAARSSGNWVASILIWLKRLPARAHIHTRTHTNISNCSKASKTDSRKHKSRMWSGSRGESDPDGMGRDGISHHKRKASAGKLSSISTIWHETLPSKKRIIPNPTVRKFWHTVSRCVSVACSKCSQLMAYYREGCEIVGFFVEFQRFSQYVSVQP